MTNRVQGTGPDESGGSTEPVVRQHHARAPASGPEALAPQQTVEGHESSPGPYAVHDTTVYTRQLMVGIAACAPDPMCRDHYRGGPGGHFFAPSVIPDEQRACARMIARALNAYDPLVATVEALCREIEHRLAGNRDDLRVLKTRVEAARRVLKVHSR